MANALKLFSHANGCELTPTECFLLFLQDLNGPIRTVMAPRFLYLLVFPLLFFFASEFAHITTHNGRDGSQKLIASISGGKKQTVNRGRKRVSEEQTSGLSTLNSLFSSVCIHYPVHTQYIAYYTIYLSRFILF